jgi:O-antigen/teichoic acid export membrane protein
MGKYISLKRNVIANYIGQGWILFLNLASVPIYLHFLGVEAYGLIGFFVSLQSLLTVLDMGLGAAVNREMARLSIAEDRNENIGNLLRTLEIIYVFTAGLIVIFIYAISTLLAENWLNVESLSKEQVQWNMVVMGIGFAVRWPFALYSGALMGMQRQVLLNEIKVINETLRNLGGIVVLWLISSTLDAFLGWQAFVGLLGTLFAAWRTWKYLPAMAMSPKFQWQQLDSIKRFALGMGGVSVTAVVLTQADKIILSKTLNLEEFGYYTLAWSLAGALGQLVTPIFNAFSPRLAQLVAIHDTNAIRHTYHLGAQWMAGIVLPVGAVLAIFSKEILMLWTHDPIISERTHLVMSIVLLGTSLNALLNMPYALQLAYGWTRLGLATNIVASAVVIPSLLFSTAAFGVEGAAFVWVGLNIVYMLIPVPIMHLKLLPDEKWNWYVKDVVVPSIISVAMVFSIREYSGLTGMQGGFGLAVLIMMVLSVMALCFLSMSYTRTSLKSFLVEKKLI